MPAWLFSILDRLGAGLVPLDGDFGRRDRAPEEGKPGLEDWPSEVARRPVDPAAEWIPSTILFGPPF